MGIVRMQEKKHILILGAGISGMSAAYYLKQMRPELQVTVLEQSERAGGWIESMQNNGFFFELGPRIFKTSKSVFLLNLIEHLGLLKEVMISTSSKQRYVLWKGSLRKVPSNLLSFCTSSITRGLLKSFFQESFRQVNHDYDETVESFMQRRLGKDVLERLVDPLLQGIYASNPSELSMRACFPSLKMMEQEHGSLTKAICKRVFMKKKKSPFLLPRDSLFSVRGGVERMIDAIKKREGIDIVYRQKVVQIDKDGKQYVVTTENKQWNADAVFIALPCSEAARILESFSEKLSSSLQKISSASVTSVLVGFKSYVLDKDGFGYLASSTEDGNILGVVFDSKSFAQNNQLPEETRLTIMLKGCDYTDEMIYELIEKSLRDHLKIVEKPDFIKIHRCPNSIPTFSLGHRDAIAYIQKDLRRHFPACYLLGNYVQGVSVSDCIKTSKEAIEHFLDVTYGKSLDKNLLLRHHQKQAPLF
jgi:oxygen-dependent protoporphyrinogen oxidase